MTTLYHPRPERWPQFTLRGLLALVTVLGCALGFYRLVPTETIFLSSYATLAAVCWLMGPAPH
jgi:hypothetical protein